MRDYYGTVETGRAYLKHFGIKGMKWGVRRYENYDGTLTEAGKKRYLHSDGSLTKHGMKAEKRREEEFRKKGWVAVQNAAANRFNVGIGKINKKYAEKYGPNREYGENFETKLGQQYIKEVNNYWQGLVREEMQKQRNLSIQKGKDWTDYVLTYHMYEDYIK